MKHQTKTQRWLPAVFAGLALAASGSVGYAASDIIFGPQGSEASVSNPDGTWINMWGPSFVSTTFDPATPPPTGDTAGSVYNQGNWTGDTGGMDDYNMISPGTWYGNVTFDASQYTSIEMDVKYDTTSTMTPTSAAHLNIGFDTGYSFFQITNESFDTASSPLADGNWHHLSIPYAAATVGSIGSTADGVAYYQWNPGGTSGTMNFWMANVQLIARVVPVAPPTMISSGKATPGLNVFASTEGNSFYDRQEALLRQPTGLSWVGQATTANPVTYAFTIDGYPNSVNCEAFMFLVPNPAGTENSPDWNETNCVIAYLQGNDSGATMHFEYKVNESYQQEMYSGAAPYTNAPGSWDGVTANYLESGDLGSVTNNGVLGTWTVMFTSDTNVTLIAPDGNSTNLVFPAYNVGYFAEQRNPGFNIYLGMQANNADAMNQAVVYSSLVVSNTASPYSENFLADTSLDTVNTWNTSISGGPKGVLVAPATASEWVTWSLPFSGFSLQTGSDLSNMGNWTSPSLYAPIPLYGVESQLVDGTELPAGGTAFFNMIKRTATQLQVLLPGETNAPGTPTGKTGTPTAEPVDGLFNVTVNAVDSTYHIVNSTDTVVLNSSTDPSAGNTAPGNALVGGTVQVTWAFDTAGSQTVTAADTTSTNITAGTSSSVTVQ